MQLLSEVLNREEESGEPRSLGRYLHSVALVTSHRPGLSDPSDSVYLLTQGVSNLPHDKNFPPEIERERERESPWPLTQL